jgi:cytochrome P450
VTPEPRLPSGADDSPSGPPPGCPAYGGRPHRLHGPEARDLRNVYERLRAEHGPVAPALLHDDVPVWVVLGHAENLHMVRTPSQYCRDSRIWTPLREGRIKPDHPLMPHIARQPVCSHAERDEHLRLRGAVTGALQTIDHRGVRRHINRHTQRLADTFCEEGRADLVGRFTEQMPMAVMCELLGMPEEYDDRMVEAARDMLKGTGTAIASHAHVMAALGRLTRRRRARPEEDLASRLVEHPARLTDDEVTEHLRVVLMSAYETTVNLTTDVLRMVLTDPRFRARLNGGQMTVPEAVEQSLWDEPPFSTVFAYFAKRNTELGGQHIRRGDALLFGIAPGNADPRIRPDPTAGMRGNRSHLAFGGGPHECPGQDIGRAIADTGVDALLTRLPDIELDCDESELRWTESIASRHLTELPVRFEPRPRQEATARPGLAAIPPQRGTWHIGTPAARPVPAPAPATAPPRPQPGHGSASARVVPGAPEPARRPRGWRRLRAWWRGR